MSDPVRIENRACFSTRTIEPGEIIYTDPKPYIACTVNDYGSGWGYTIPHALPVPAAYVTREFGSASALEPDPIWCMVDWLLRNPIQELDIPEPGHMSWYARARRRDADIGARERAWVVALMQAKLGSFWTILRLYAQIKAASYTFRSPISHEPYAQCLYPIMDGIRHSCLPNTVCLTNKEGACVVIAYTRIPAETLLTINRRRDPRAADSACLASEPTWSRTLDMAIHGVPCQCSECTETLKHGLPETWRVECHIRSSLGANLREWAGFSRRRTPTKILRDPARVRIVRTAGIRAASNSVAARIWREYAYAIARAATRDPDALEPLGSDLVGPAFTYLRSTACLQTVITGLVAQRATHECITTRAREWIVHTTALWATCAQPMTDRARQGLCNAIVSATQDAFPDPTNAMFRRVLGLESACTSRIMLHFITKIT